MTLLTPEQVAEMTQLNVVTIRRQCAAGKLRASKPAGQWRIYEDAVEEWLRSSEPEPGVVQPARKVARNEGELRLVAGGVSA